MPAITGQSIVVVNDTTVIITVNTTNFGTLSATMQMQINGNCTVVLTQNSLPILNTALANATASSIETEVQNALMALVTVGGVAQMQIRVHVFSLNPFRLTIGTFDVNNPIPVIWW